MLIRLKYNIIKLLFSVEGLGFAVIQVDAIIFF